MIAENAVSDISRKKYEQSNSILAGLDAVFGGWSDIAQTAVGQFYILTEEVVAFFVPAATRLEQAKSARIIVKELAALNENWDGYGASAISQQTLDNALRFIDTIEAAPHGLPAPEISPTPNGTISFEWEAPHTEAYLEIGNTRYSGFITTDGQQSAFLEGRSDSMDQQIVAVLQSAMSLTASHPASITEIHTQSPKHEHLAT